MDGPDSTGLTQTFPFAEDIFIEASKCKTKQELSYCKQIARQLRTQYAEDNNSNPVTLKSRLRVTQGH